MMRPHRTHQCFLWNSPSYLRPSDSCSHWVEEDQPNRYSANVTMKTIESTTVGANFSKGWQKQNNQITTGQKWPQGFSQLFRFLNLSHQHLMVTGCKCLVIYFGLKKKRKEEKEKNVGFSGVSISHRMERINTQKATGSGNLVWLLAAVWLADVESRFAEQILKAIATMSAAPVSTTQKAVAFEILRVLDSCSF